jgi:hypothetical protein
MTAQISAYGRLVADPQTRTTGKGTNMAMARLAVALPCNAADNGEATFWLGVIAFGKQADALAKHHKGDHQINGAICYAGRAYLMARQAIAPNHRAGINLHMQTCK